MNSQILILSLTSASLAFMHTVLGPDHYLPFIVLAKARKWSNIKTIWITILCGLGHIGSSIIIGAIGIALGIAVSKLNYFESIRGNIAGWLFISFGLAYTVWGIRRAYKSKPHSHTHFHTNGKEHIHTHTHFDEHSHIHSGTTTANGEFAKTPYKNLTPWVLFIIFVLGPCEPLIPLIMFPAMQHSTLGVFTVTSVFAIVTILTMTTIVMLMSTGLKFIKLEKLEKFSHAIAGSTILLSGLAIQVLGL